jgi:Adenomatosis polyposis coli down-regulated 1
MRFALGLIVIVLSVVSHEPDVAARAPDQASPALAGHWTSIGCEAATPTAERSIRRDFVFSDWSWRDDVTLYQGARCAAPLAGIRIEGSYVISGPSARVTKTSEATFFYTRKSAAALTPAGATMLTSAKCGATPWRAGLVQDVSDTGCIGFPAITSACLQEFDIVLMSATELRFGARTPSMCTPEGRPTQASPFAVARRSTR